MGTGEPRYRLEALDAVLRALGCRAATSAVDRQTRAWVNPELTSRDVARIATFRTDSGELSIGYGSVVSIATMLGLDAAEVVRRLSESGGELLEP